MTNSLRALIKVVRDNADVLDLNDPGPFALYNLIVKALFEESRLKTRIVKLQEALRSHLVHTRGRCDRCSTRWGNGVEEWHLETCLLYWKEE